MIIVKNPDECSIAELKKFSALVLEGGEVTAVGLDTRIKKAERLIFSIDGDHLTGIAAIKNPDESYKQGVFQKAQATSDAEKFSLELGWIFVSPSLRGTGLSHRLVEAALSVTNNQAVFATSRKDNTRMHKVLMTHGFSPHGKTYASIRGNQSIALFSRLPPESN